MHDQTHLPLTAEQARLALGVTARPQPFDLPQQDATLSVHGGPLHPSVQVPPHLLPADHLAMKKRGMPVSQAEVKLLGRSRLEGVKARQLWIQPRRSSLEASRLEEKIKPS